MSNDFNKINDEIRKYFGLKLVSMIIFGSSCRKNKINLASDIDYIIILRGKVSVSQAAKLSRNFKRKFGSSVALLSFNIYGKDIFKKLIYNNPWLALSIGLGFRIIVDKDGFFTDNLNNVTKEIKAKQIAPLGWKIKSAPRIPNLISHLERLSADFLNSADIVVARNPNIACLLLLKAMHCKMSAALYRRNVFITSGEITQCFFKSIQVRKNNFFRNELLALEQTCGLLDKMSFDFNPDGSMCYCGNNKLLKNLYRQKKRIISSLFRTVI